MSDDPFRIAMWSGPRNISTAMMRSWGSRADTHVTDEPLYAHYLSVTGREHPGRSEILARYENDWRAVVARLTGPVPGGRRIWFQKHMTHHLTPDVDREWMTRVRHCFLIRDPREVITSYLKVIPAPTVQDLGYAHEAEIFDWVRLRLGGEPPVLEARRVLEDPRRVLGRLCEVLGLPFDEAMLAWSPGIHPTDGIWAPHWYGNVVRSTGFAPYRPKPDRVPDQLAGVHEICREHYRRLLEHAL